MPTLFNRNFSHANAEAFKKLFSNSGQYFYIGLGVHEGDISSTTPTDSFDAGVFASSGGLQTTAFTVSDADLTGLKSLCLKIAGSADHKFEIQDISILYRVRPVK